MLILGANMGAGHEQVGRELARRLAGFGVAAKQVDLGQLLPPGWGRALTGFYKFMAYRAQGLYEATFRLQMSTPPGSVPVVFPLDLLAERRLRGLVERERPSLIVSTFHLSSQVAGRMREAGKLDVPVVSMVLDFFVHGMWVHPGVDAHVLLHRAQVHQVVARGGREPVVCGPFVRPQFDLAHPGWDRAAARSSLGLGESELCVLVVGGSWGVGKVTETYALVAGDKRFFPVAVAGHNRGLLRSLSGARQAPGAAGAVFGWVEDMDRLMAAADVAVENGCGITVLEAMARGVPVVTYAPIAGHGRANAVAMAEAGITAYAHGPSELLSCLDELARGTPARQRLVGRARSMFGADPAATVAAWALSGEVGEVDVPAPACPAPACAAPACPADGCQATQPAGDQRGDQAGGGRAETIASTKGSAPAQREN